MKIKLTLLLFFITFSLFSQPWLNGLSEEEKNEFGFNEHKAAFDTYWKGKQIDNGYYFEEGIKTKAYGWKQFKRWENYWSTKVEPSTGKFPSSEQMATADLMYKSSSQNRSISGEWANLGPVSSSGGYAGVGRLNCIAFHPSESNTFWVGAPSGGVWKTIDGGLNWSVLTDENNVLGVSAVAITSDYVTSQTLYIGTGDRDSWRHNNGEGILKSTDGGLTWNSSLLFDIADNYTVNQILIHPTNNDILYAATTYGIYKTTNAGSTWTRIYSEYYISDLEFKPGDPSTLYASNKHWGRIYKLTNNGANISMVYNGYEDDAKRIELAVSPSNPNLVYAIIGNPDGGLKGIYKSINSGDDFALVTSTPNILANNVEGTGVSGQAWYDLALIVDPLDEDILYCGGVNTWKSTDGGANWSINNFWTSYYCNTCEIVHADKHFFGFNGTTLYECNDGGLYKSEDGASWENISNGIVNSQMYRIAVSQINPEVTITGLQDNGTKLKASDGNWYDVVGGDGMNCEIDPTDDDVMYGAIQNGRVRRTINGWSSNTDITKDGDGDPINDLDETGAWITPYVIDPNSSSTLYIGLENVWKSLDRGDSWSKISTINNEDKLETICLSASNSQVIYTAENEQIWKTANGGSSWVDVSSNLPGSFITSIAIKHDDPNTVWLSLGTYNSDVVYQTTNGGGSWINISAGLPDIPANTIIQNTQNLTETELYAGTDFGVYVKVGTESWALFNTGMPKVAVTDLEIYYDVNPDNSILRAGTWGRGLWESDLYAFEVIEPVVDFSASSTNLCINNTIEFTDLSTNTPSEWTWLITPATGYTFENGTTSNSENPEIEFTQAGIYSIQLTAVNENGSGELLKTDYIQVNDVPTEPSLITGETSICEDAEEIYSVEVIEGLTYNWTLPEGWNGTSTSHSISIVPNSISGSIFVTAENICGESLEQTLSINVTALPAIPVFDQNPTEICELEETTYSVINIPTCTYNWSLPLGWTGESFTNSIMATPNANSGTISVNSENSCGMSGSAQVMVNVSSLPENPILEFDFAELCNAEEVMFVVGNDNGYTYNWTLPVGWIGSSSAAAIAVTNNGVSGALSVYAENDCGISGTVSFEISVIDATPEQPSIITGETLICENAEEIYSVVEVEGLSYNWNLPDGWEGSSVTNSISIVSNNTSGTISLTAQNTCGLSLEQNLSIDVTALPSIPEFEDNPTELCEGIEAIYSVISNPDYTYEWGLPETWLGNSSSHSINVVPGVNSGIINVTAINTCGNSAVASTSVNVSSIPETPTFVDPATEICIVTETTYSVFNNAEYTYEWSLPLNWTGNSVTNSIDVTPNFMSGVLSVSAQNSCGISQEASVSIDVIFAANLPSIISGQDNVCEASEVVYSVEPVEGNSFSWQLPDTWEGSSETNTITTTVGEASALINVQASNVCGSSALRSKDVTVNLLPVADFTYVEDMATYSFTNLSEEADSYVWNFGDDVESSEIHPSHTYVENGNFTIRLIAENECSNHIFEVDVNIINIGINENELEDISLFPNPSKGVISVIGLKNMSYEIKVFDLTGRNLIHKNFESQNSIDIDLSRYSDGAYQVVIKQGDLQVKKLVILQK